MQIIRSAFSILLIIPSLAYIMHKQFSFNLEEMEKLKKVLEEENIALAIQSLKIKQRKKEAKVQAKL